MNDLRHSLKRRRSVVGNLFCLMFTCSEIPDASSLGSRMTLVLAACERFTSFPKATEERSRESFLGLIGTYLALLNGKFLIA